MKRRTRSAISGLMGIVVNHGLVLLPRRRSDGSKGEVKKGAGNNLQHSGI